MNRVDFRDKVYAFTEKKALFSAPCHVLVGVSGGADSMALLHTLLHWPMVGLRVSAVHIHHGLRGRTADSDERFVQDFCRNNNVDLFVFHEDVAAFSEENGLSIEEAGRRLRYMRFEEARLSCGADVIATAHTASDRAETVLLRIVRGTGVDGLTGIPVRRGRICRPLLSCTRAEIEQYCAEFDIPYITDDSNRDMSFTRNRIRHRILPLLREINPSVDEALVRVAEHAREDSEALLTMAWQRLEDNRGQYGYDVSAFTNAIPAVSRRMILLMMRDDAISSIEESHVLACEKAIIAGKGNVLLPDGFVLSVSQGCVVIRKDNNDLSSSAVSIDSFPISVKFCEKRYSVDVIEKENRIVHNLFSNTMCDYDKIKGVLQLRCRCENDSIHPAGRGVGKSLKKLMNECDVPAFIRDKYPILCDDTGVIMVPGYAVDERVKVTDDTKHLLVWKTDDVTG